jgi:hypothetical protein
LASKFGGIGELWPHGLGIIALSDAHTPLFSERHGYVRFVRVPLTAGSHGHTDEDALFCRT